MIFDRVEKEEKKIVFIYTTCSNKEEARLIGFSVIEERLAVCADFWPINSIYPWQDVIQEASQYMLMITTEKLLAEKLIKFVEKIHSYKIPFITEIDSSISNSAYKLWVNKTLEGKTKYLSTYEKEQKDQKAEEGVYQYGRLSN